MTTVRRLGPDDVRIVASIDRAEHVDIEYRLIDGVLTPVAATVPDIPPWDPVGTGSHSVVGMIEFCEPVLARGGTLLATFAGDQPSGVAIVEAEFEPPMAWLTLLSVSRPYRREGAAQALWNAVVDIAVTAGATSLYVSATPTESAVGFYLQQGCVLADPVHPELYAHEPEDIHFVCALTRSR